MQHDNEGLKLAVWHLAFDAYHFRCYSKLYRSLGSGVVKQAVIYSLLLHFRVLLNFFYPPPKKQIRDDDLFVHHFLNLPGFADRFHFPISDPPVSAVDRLKVNLNKRLAHMTATRWLDEPAPGMHHYAQLFDPIDRLIERFEQALPDEIRTKFSARLQHWAKVHPPCLK